MSRFEIDSEFTVVKLEIYIIDLQQLCDIIMSTWTKILRGTFQAFCWIYATKN